MENCGNALSQLQAAASTPLRDWQPFIAENGHVAGSCAIEKQHWKICTVSKVSNKRDSSSYGL